MEAMPPNLPITFSPTFALQSSAGTIGESVRSDVEAVPPETIAALNYSEFTDITRDYELFYQVGHIVPIYIFSRISLHTRVAKFLCFIQSEQTVHTFLSSADEKRHFSLRLMVLQAGKILPIEQ